MYQAEAIRKARISIRGIVQGVGFRPFVFQLATKYGLRGWVCNTSGDVRIDVEGERATLEQFLVELETQVFGAVLEPDLLQHGISSGVSLLAFHAADQ